MSVGQQIIDLIENRRRKKRLTQHGAEGDFWRHGGNELLFDALPVVTGSVVVDAGAYRGEWSTGMIARYGCRIVLFEPVPDLASDLKKYFHNNMSVQVFDVALGSKDGRLPISLEQDGSSLYKGVEGSPCASVCVVDVARQFEEMGLSEISCLKLNVEGGEYDVLERLIEKGLLQSCISILVQFHRQPPGYDTRYANIEMNLATSHTLRWRYPFVWELWTRK